MALLPPPSTYKDPFSCVPFALTSNSSLTFLRSNSASLGAKHRICGSSVNSTKIEDTHLKFPGLVKKNPPLRLEASRDSIALTQEVKINKMESVVENDSEIDVFEEMRHRFLRFKKNKYMENSNHFENLARSQAPKFLVIACADSRVCPSSILGFEPGEAFMVRNVANLVPPFENGPTETNAALEFAVTSLEVENIFVIGHSCCGGIRALMSMPDDADSSSFIRNWVVVGKNARLSTKAAAGDLSFEQQCRHCEKESVNHSLVNLLSYPWIKERVCKGVLSIHGGYYNFVNCTFEKWTLDYKGSNMEKEGGKYANKAREFWS